MMLIRDGLGKLQSSLRYLSALGSRDDIQLATEDVFINGLDIATTLYYRVHRAQGSNYDPQDLVVGYTTEFISTIRVCQRYGVGASTALRLAKLSYTLGANKLQSLFTDYPQVNTSVITFAALNYPGTDKETGKPNSVVFLNSLT